MKKVISYTLLGASFFLALYLIFNSAVHSGSEILVLILIDLILMVVGGVLYSSGYIKRLVVADIKDYAIVSDSIDVSIIHTIKIYDEDGNEYKCSPVLSDMFQKGGYYEVRVSYDGEIISIVG